MTRVNLILIDRDAEDFVCNGCDGRPFRTEEGLLQHCRTAGTHRGEWCERCRWLFVSSDARDDHRRASHQHWVCHFCHLDETSRSELVSHMSEEHEHCYDCGEDLGYEDYEDHRVDTHNLCRDCGREFGSANELLMHKQVHQTREHECYGCTREFKSPSGIMIHLESSACESGIEIRKINEWAFACPESDYFTNDWDDRYKYHCPTCHTNMGKISSLFQHVESPACDASYHGIIEELREYIADQAS